MASEDFEAHQHPLNINSVHSPPSHLSPQNPRHHFSRVGKSEVNSSSRRIRNRYKSAFTEIGLEEAANTTNYNTLSITSTRPGSRVRWRSQVEIHEAEQQEEMDNQREIPRATPATWHRYGSSAKMLSRLSFLAVVLAIMIPVLHMSPLLHAGPAMIGAEAGPIAPNAARHYELEESTKLLPRQNNAAAACLRWSHQSAVVNGTLFLYGGRQKTDSNQVSNQWSELGSVLDKCFC